MANLPGGSHELSLSHCDVSVWECFNFSNRTNELRWHEWSRNLFFNFKNHINQWICQCRILNFEGSSTSIRSLSLPPRQSNKLNKPWLKQQQEWQEPFRRSFARSCEDPVWGVSSATQSPSAPQSHQRIPRSPSGDSTLTELSKTGNLARSVTYKFVSRFLHHFWVCYISQSVVLQTNHTSLSNTIWSLQSQQQWVSERPTYISAVAWTTYHYHCLNLWIIINEW